jgi:AAA+ superfamily predicted ATPase
MPEDSSEAMDEHAGNLRLGLDWLAQLVTGALRVHLGAQERFHTGPLGYHEGDTWLPRFLTLQNPTPEEFAIFMLALAPHLDPGFLGRLIAAQMPEGGDLPELGGARVGNQRDILPTGETAEFILAAGDLRRRLEVKRLFSGNHWFARRRILRLEPVREGEPAMSGRLVLDPEVVEEITVGKVNRPVFSTEFPAEHIETRMDWDDLVLHPATEAQIREIEHWIDHHKTLLDDWGMGKKIKPGYRALFHGLPGTGKTMTATLLGKQAGMDVFRIDLSRIVSKYIGETEKNLSRLFDKAENKNWMLFFDEADALFGKRTEIRDAHDKYANQEVAYLLQRIEAHPGVVILASNQRANIDEAFVRRLQSIIHFPMPRPEERYRIWRKTFPEQIAVAEDVDWKHIAARHELTGAGILNVTQFCAIDFLARKSPAVDLAALEAAIQREYVKEGKIV